MVEMTEPPGSVMADPTEITVGGGVDRLNPDRLLVTVVLSRRAAADEVIDDDDDETEIGATTTTELDEVG